MSSASFVMAVSLLFPAPAYRNALVAHDRDPYTGFRVVVSASEG